MAGKYTFGRLVIFFSICLCLGALLILSCTDADDTTSELSWKKIHDAAAPYPSNDRMAVYDPDRDRLVLFGGTYIRDTWEYDGQKWWQIDTERAVPVRYGGSACYHGGLKGTILFGGSDKEGKDSNQLWFYDGQGWDRLTSDTPGPAPRHNAGLSYDTRQGRLVLFGGESEAGVLNDTWVWKAGHWNKIETDNKPSPRKGHGQVYDYSRGITVVFGGAGQARDTWAFDGSDWSLIESTITPLPRFFPAMTYDSADDTVVMIGGQTHPSSTMNPLKDHWLLEGNEWTRLQVLTPDLGLKYPKLSYVPGRGQMYFYTSLASFYPPREAYSILYTVKGQKMVETPIVDGPQPFDYGIALVDWKDQEQFLLFSSYDRNCEECFWQLDGMHWSRSKIQRPPYAHLLSNVTMVYNRNDDVLFLFPGHHYYDPVNFFRHFEYAGGQWSERECSAGPMAQNSSAIAYDTQRNVLVLFGGYCTHGTYDPELDETWEYDGEHWRQCFPENSPSKRWGCVMAFDEDRSVMVLHGGSDEGMRRRDTWEYDGTTWRKVETAHAPIKVGPMVYHTGLKRILLFSEMDWAYEWDNYFWCYDGNDWEPVPRAEGTSNGPSPRMEATMAFHPESTKLVFFGGVGSGNICYADTWEFTP